MRHTTETSKPARRAQEERRRKGKKKETCPLPNLASTFRASRTRSPPVRIYLASDEACVSGEKWEEKGEKEGRLFQGPESARNWPARVGFDDRRDQDKSAGEGERKRKKAASKQGSHW